MYSNIPITQTKQILDNMLAFNLANSHIRSKLLDWYEVITRQNYFQHNDKTITQPDGLAMGAPSSTIISEIFLQHLEHTHLPHLAQKHKLVNYFRYVDDILLIYDSQHTRIHSLLHDLNSIHPSKPSIYPRSRTKQHNYLFGHNHSQNTNEHQNFHLQKTNFHRHHYPIHLKSPHTT